MTQNGIDNSMEFPYRPDEIDYFSVMQDTFIISLKTGETVLHVPANASDFRQWLAGNGIRNIDESREKRYNNGTTNQEQESA